MVRKLVLGGLVGVALFGPAVLRADDGDPGQALPMPQPVPAAHPAPPVAVEMYPVYPPRRNPYDVWQFYSVDQRGMWRPRVVYDPYGPYYLYNGQPYLYTETHPREFRATIMGTPYRSEPALYAPVDQPLQGPSFSTPVQPPQAPSTMPYLTD